MQLSQVECAVAVAEQGSFTAAAEALRMTQPSVSAAVARLEASLGAELFDRASRPVRLTPAGEVFVDGARRLLRDAASLVSSVGAVTSLAGGHVTIAALPTAAAGTLADLLGPLRATHPEVTVRVLAPATSREVAWLVGNGECEVGISDAPAAGLAHHRLGTEPFVVALPPADAPAHPLGSTRSAQGQGSSRAVEPEPEPLGPDDLAELSFVLPFDRGAPANAGDAAARRSARAGVEIEAREAILPLVVAGAGATILPSTLAAAAEAMGCDVRLTSPPIEVDLHLLWRAGALSPAAASLVDLARA